MKLRLSIALAILVFICTQAWAQKPADLERFMPAPTMHCGTGGARCSGT